MPQPDRAQPDFFRDIPDVHLPRGYTFVTKKEQWQLLRKATFSAPYNYSRQDATFITEISYGRGWAEDQSLRHRSHRFNEAQQWLKNLLEEAQKTRDLRQLLAGLDSILLLFRGARVAQCQIWQKNEMVTVDFAQISKYLEQNRTTLRPETLRAYVRHQFGLE